MANETPTKAPLTAPLFDRLVAKVVLERVSRLSVRHPHGFGDLVMGKQPRLWLATRTHIDDVPDWRRYEADKAHPAFFPADYVNGFWIAAPKGAIANAAGYLDRTYGGQAVPAAALTVGKAVIAAEIPPYAGNELHPSEDFLGYRAAILGLGGGAVDVSIGALHIQERVFAGAEQVRSGEVKPLQALAVTLPTTPRLL